MLSGAYVAGPPRQIQPLPSATWACDKCIWNTSKDGGPVAAHQQPAFDKPPPVDDFGTESLWK
jgi:hypothetical protein